MTKFIFLLYLAKIRRLYDIANVFSSIGIIEKYLSNNSSISKPAYRYIGPEVDILREAECKRFCNN